MFRHNIQPIVFLSYLSLPLVLFCYYISSPSEGSFTTNYGYLPCIISRDPPACWLSWTDVNELVPEAAGRTVLVRGWVQAIRSVGKKLTFLVVRDGFAIVQCVIFTGKAGVVDEMTQFSRNIPKESFIRIEGIVSVPSKPLQGTTQQVELSVNKIYCISQALNLSPFLFEDATRSYEELKDAVDRGQKLPDVALDIRLNNRPYDLRTPANQAIFRIQSLAESEFCKILASKGFLGTHTPKITPGVSEGGSAVFMLKYVNGQTASLAQSPQLYKQMLINAGLKQVMEVGVYRAEKSNTYRHLCEYIGLHAEMEIKEHYFEVIDIVDILFVKLFDHITQTCKAELDILKNQHPFEPLKVKV
ncbi:hypothetical protein PR202_gb15095 [Eleusine coracana subsp. coracana]|uniref:Aspartyl-tRNA synthetase n=1 Tax=Eleusine coracana subsp. coracana TaxID=191504 RepID=A0AAV5EY39_ELECO|nr:hypothetical protein PR202_gb15095 [Eleusine coracana subsp. coracana]